MNLASAKPDLQAAQSALALPDLHGAFAVKDVQIDLANAVAIGVNIMDVVKNVIAWLVANSATLIELKDIVVKIVEIIKGLLPQQPAVIV